MSLDKNSVIKIDLLIIVVNWNTKNMLLECLESIRRLSNIIEVRTLIIDNGSTDGSVELLESCYSDFYLILNSDNLGFGQANNQGIKMYPNYSYYLFLNSDAKVTADVILEMYQQLEKNPKLAAVGPALKLPTGELQLGSAGYGPNWKASFNTFFFLSKISRLFKGIFIFQTKYVDLKTPVSVNWLAFACKLFRKQ